MPTIHQRDLKALKIGGRGGGRGGGGGVVEEEGEGGRRSGGGGGGGEEGEVEEEEEEKDEEWRRRGRKRRSGEARTHSRTAAANRVYFKIRHRSTYRSVVLFVYMNQYKHIWIVCI